MHSYFSGHTHQDYLNRLHASAALAADQHALEASANLRASLNRSSRKRALSASPGYAEIDLANLIRHSPTSLQLLNAAATANGGSPSSSGSYGQLSGKYKCLDFTENGSKMLDFTGANSPVLQGLHQASSHLQQLQAHLLRTSPYLSPQNSFIHAASYLPPPVALFGGGGNAAAGPANNKTDTDATKEDNVVSSTMEDMSSVDHSSKREKKKGGKKSRAAGNLMQTVLQQEASSSTGNDREDEDERDFVETHCHWVNCDRDFDTQDQLVKVK